MAALAVVGAGFATAGPGIFGAGALAAVGSAAAIGIAAYIDNAFIYPALFGEDQQHPAAFQGLDLSTQDTGGPRTIAFGPRVRVPCHLAWMSSLDQQDTSSGGK